MARSEGKGVTERAVRKARQASVARGQQKFSLAEFFGNIKGEWKKVTWPDREELTKSTFVVVVMLILISAYLGAVDYIVSIVFMALGLN
jgi:preprotein translocase subunit SecE